MERGFRMDYTTRMPQGAVLEAAHTYFATRWPYGGRCERHGSSVSCTVKPHRNLYELLVWIIAIGEVSRHTQTTELITRSAEGRTHVKIFSDVPEHAAVLEAWAQEELGVVRLS